MFYHTSEMQTIKKTSLFSRQDLQRYPGTNDDYETYVESREIPQKTRVRAVVCDCPTGPTGSTGVNCQECDCGCGEASGPSCLQVDECCEIKVQLVRGETGPQGIQVHF